MSDVGGGHVPWIEKYRPSELASVHGHDEVIGTIRRFLESGALPNLLFHGPAGTGKTTCAVAICKEIFGAANYRMSTLELNASDERGIDVVRTRVKEFARSTSFGSFTFAGQEDSLSVVRKAFKIVILDEADSMTSAAQFALRRMIEQFSGTARFIIICNYANKIIPALVSRCTSFRFSALPEQHTTECLRKVAREECIEVTDSAVRAFAHISGGDLRKVLNLLQSLTIVKRAQQRHGETGGGTANIRVTDADVYRTVGKCTPSEIKALVKDLLTLTDYDAMVRRVGECAVGVVPRDRTGVRRRGAEAGAGAAGKSGSSAEAIQFQTEPDVTKNVANLLAILGEIHAVFTHFKFQSCQQRKQFVECLAKIETRLSQGSLNEHYEVSFLVQEILALRTAWQAAPNVQAA